MAKIIRVKKAGKSFQMSNIRLHICKLTTSDAGDEEIIMEVKNGSL